jgi:hypothetical protein
MTRSLPLDNRLGRKEGGRKEVLVGKARPFQHQDHPDLHLGQETRISCSLKM